MTPGIRERCTRWLHVVIAQISEDDQFVLCGTTSGDIMKINLRTRLLSDCGPVKVKFGQVGQTQSWQVSNSALWKSLTVSSSCICQWNSGGGSSGDLVLCWSVTCPFDWGLGSWPCGQSIEVFVVFLCSRQGFMLIFEPGPLQGVRVLRILKSGNLLVGSGCGSFTLCSGKNFKPLK